jgi:hypothetical protein
MYTNINLIILIIRVAFFGGGRIAFLPLTSLYAVGLGKDMYTAYVYAFISLLSIIFVIF